MKLRNSSKQLGKNVKKDNQVYRHHNATSQPTPQSRCFDLEEISFQPTRTLEEYAKTLEEETHNFRNQNDRWKKHNDNYFVTEDTRRKPAKL